MGHYEQILLSIIKAQEAIIGPLAYEEARKTGVIQIDDTGNQLTLSGDPKTAIEMLVTQYANLFGKISIQVSKEAAQLYISNVKDIVTLPPSLT